MAEFKWLEDRVETLSGGAYKFGTVGDLEIERINDELSVRAEAFAILGEAKLAFAAGQADYADGAARLIGIIRARREAREMMEEVYGWLDLCFDGRTPIAELPESLKLKFAVEAAVNLLVRQRKAKEKRAPVAEVSEPEPVPV